ncbi:MAG TPA: polysaccharide deacetylase family protein [Terriglobales bacterium]|nr:polysaccharide deacetylase family protein [Terriglobales bacterium]
MRGLLLQYHAIGAAAPDGDRRYSVSAAAFRRHLALLNALSAAGTLEVQDLAEWWRGRNKSRRLGVVLCFDDGARTDYELAFPLLQEAGLHATFFVSSGLVGQPGYLTWSQIAEMQRWGMRFEAHGHAHHALSALSPPGLDRELRTARHMLQEHIGTAVQYLAAPFGLWSARVLEAAKYTGFQALCTSHPGLARPGHNLLPRNALRATTSDRQLQHWLQQRPGCFAWRVSREWLLWTPKQIMLHFRAGWPEARPRRTESTSTS